MRLNLSANQRSQIELLSMHSGKPAAQLLTEAARFLCDNDMAFLDSVERGFAPSGCQQFLPAEELDRRFERILGRCS